MKSIANGIFSKFQSHIGAIRIAARKNIAALPDPDDFNPTLVQLELVIVSPVIDGVIIISIPHWCN